MAAEPGRRPGRRRALNAPKGGAHPGDLAASIVDLFRLTRPASFRGKRLVQQGTGPSTRRDPGKRRPYVLFKNMLRLSMLAVLCVNLEPAP